VVQFVPQTANLAARWASAVITLMTITPTFFFIL
jgi:hypothetical protein